MKCTVKCMIWVGYRKKMIDVFMNLGYTYIVVDHRLDESCSLMFIDFVLKLYIVAASIVLISAAVRLTSSRMPEP